MLKNPRPFCLLAGAAAAALLTGCSGSSSAAKPVPSSTLLPVPSPVATVPAYVTKLSQTIGEYVVTPDPALTTANAHDVLDAVASIKGVQSAKLVDSKLRVEILPDATTAQRDDILRELAALGQVSEGT
ncbi:MAG: hypothetical protein JWP14_2460 [Frankiales bacterium]|jgi:ABC-type phosphate/phosphonate transport system substrate-binding protein|nr:hypothetical protein [Frankiales bacterium]